MKALIQRVTSANVKVNGAITGEIGKGLLVFLAVEKNDTESSIEKLVHKLVHYRIFSDDENKMNLNIQDINGDILIVSQFTLAASTEKGLRPSFSDAASPEKAFKYYNYFVDKIRSASIPVSTGIFGEDMKVELINDGPVTFLLNS
jgi:D-tyrosyl-tRNA(Tyr) deacylase